MSLARAMTKRMKRTAAPEETMPSRSKSVRNPTLQIDRAQISLPVALLSSTNTLVYDAPDLSTMDFAALRAASSATSTHSADDSDNSISGRSRASSQGSRDTLTDASSVSSSPTSPAPNHLSGYFPAPNGKSLRKSASTTSLSNVKENPSEPTEPVPAIPQRALSHSKRAHVQLAQKRSMQNLSRGTSMSSRGSLGSLREQRSSMDMFNIATVSEEPAPFAAELEQLNEAVEEFSGVARSAEEEADLECMRQRGLATFCAADYMAVIQPLFKDMVAPRMAWI
ncbi:hypothetical protein N0V91_002932 [Didymella pomorum]|jgi:hypothetical protein|uniref:Uncharacterized protein n=1 Tax=Didymella pomorum TaxID=749634 RepID=A0A9W8ZJT4_9PLEO|nr:hypothetical protein N0V91_002932 [Didymella pomorum]